MEKTSRINNPWEEMGVEYGPRGVSPKPPQKRMKPAGNIGSEVAMAPKKKKLHTRLWLRQLRISGPKHSNLKNEKLWLPVSIKKSLVRVNGLVCVDD